VKASFVNGFIKGCRMTQTAVDSRGGSDPNPALRRRVWSVDSAYKAGKGILFSPKIAFNFAHFTANEAVGLIKRAKFAFFQSFLFIISKYKQLIFKTILCFLLTIRILHLFTTINPLSTFYEAINLIPFYNYLLLFIAGSTKN
jgi:hypothetical protein